MINKVKLEYCKVYGENLYLGTANFSDDTIIFRDNFSNIISVGFPRKIIINESSQNFSYLFNMFIVNFYFKVWIWLITMLILKYH